MEIRGNIKLDFYLTFLLFFMLVLIKKIWYVRAALRFNAYMHVNKTG